MIFGLINHSSVTLQEINLIREALAIQLGQVASVWDRQRPAVLAYPDPSKIPTGIPDFMPVHILASGSQAGELGIHSGAGCRIFVNLATRLGAPVLRDPAGRATVAAVISHEVIEAFLDPYTNLWALSSTTLWAYEACDPVQAKGYDLGGVTVSNFVYPSWFDPNGKAPFDQLGILKAPFTVAPGGYALSFDHKKDLCTSIFGFTEPPFFYPHPSVRAGARIGGSYDPATEYLAGHA